MGRPDTDPRNGAGGDRVALTAGVLDPAVTRVPAMPQRVETPWAEQFRNGDQEAFRALIQAFQERLLRLGFRMFGQRAEAEDFAQEALVRVYEKRRHYDARRPLAPWLFTVAVNLGRERLRRRREWPQGDRLPEGVQEADGEKNLLRAERKQLVQQALGRVPELFRECLALRYEADLSLKELAQALQVPVGTVKSRLSRGLAAFQRQYQLLGGEAA